MKEILNNVFPILSTLKSYTVGQAKKDLYAGLMVTILLIPQAMAYAYLAGVPPQYGLYAGLVPVLVYAILGTSHHLAVGPVAITSILLFAAIGTIAEPFSPEYIQLIIASGIIIGVLQMLFGILRLGVLVNLLSHPVLSGFISAAALIILISQSKDLLGISIPAQKYLHQKLVYLCSNLSSIHFLTASIAAGAYLFVVLIKKYKKSIPASLILVIVAILASKFLDLESQGVAIVGAVSSDLPSFIIPSITWEQIKIITPLLLPVTLIGLIESIGLAKVMEKDYDYRIRPNQEFIAHGMSKVLGAFFSALPSSASYGRSAISKSQGRITSMHGVYTVGILMICLLTLMQYIHYLPKVILAVIIVLAVKNLFAISTAKHLLSFHKMDFIMMILTFLITLFVGMELGVLSGVILSFLGILIKSSRPRVSLLGKVAGEEYYRNVDLYDNLSLLDSVLIIRFDDQIYFANADFFREKTLSILEKESRDIKFLVLDVRGVQDIDSSGIRALEDLNSELLTRGIQLKIGGAIGPVRDRFAKSGFKSKIGEEHFYRFLKDAVACK